MGLTLFAGRHSSAPVAVVLIAAWVLTPFVALAVAVVASKRWPRDAQRTLYKVTFVVAAGSLVAYAGAGLRTPPRTPIFVITAPIAWALVAGAFIWGVRSSRR
jgi:peptidoglycan/LPS O-acetylase OafA/YrhL